MKNLIRSFAPVMLLVLIAASTLGCVRTPPLASSHATAAERIEKLKAKAAELDRKGAARPAGLTATSGGRS